MVNKAFFSFRDSRDRTVCWNGKQGIFLLSGIVETGLFVGMVNKAYFGNDEGNVNVREKNS